MYLNEFDILDIIDQAVKFGVESIGQQNVLALQIAGFWLEGYISGKGDTISEGDIKTLRATMKNYFFI